MAHPTTARALAGLGMVLLGVALLRALHPWTAAFDIYLYDETGYLNGGLTFSLERYRDYARTGLYPAFYGALSWIVTDPLRLMPVAAMAVLSLATVSLFVALRAASRSTGVAVAFTGLFLLGHLLTVAPRVSFLALAVMAATVAAVCAARGTYAKLTLAAAGAYVLCYARAEYVLALYGVLALSLLMLAAALVARRLPAGRDLFTRQHAMRHAAGHAALAFLVLAGLFFSFPVPGESKRSFMAFGQHFAVREVAVTGRPVDPWTHWESLTEEAFPGARSIPQAATAAPARFAGHIAANGREALGWFGGTLAATAWAQATGRGPLIAVAAFGFLAAGAALAVLAARRRAASRTVDPAGDRGLPLDLAVIALLGAGPLVSALLIYPRDHYLLLVFPALLMVAARLLRQPAEDGGPASALVTAAAGAALVVAVPTLPPDSRPVTTVIQALRAVDPPPRRMLEVDGGWCVYVLPRCATVYTFNLAPGLDAAGAIATHAIDAIMVSPRFRGQGVIAGDPSWQALLADPGAHGFRVEPMPFDYVLLRRDPPAAGS